MEKVRDYIARMKMLYTTFLKYVESENNSPEDFQEFISFISSNQYDVNSDEFRSLLHIISKVSNHHKQTPIFRDKILRILNHYIEKIKQTFSNSEIFQFFRNNKFILAFLFDEKIIVADEQIANYIYSAFGVRNSALFYPEIKPFLNEKSINFIMNLLDCSEINDPEFIHKRQEGQNDSHICKLIREDSIDEFKNFLKEEDIDSCDDVPDSIFESNNFLANNETSLVEYAAFCKANKIFEFLKEEELFLGNLWPYAINGQNEELIEFLRKNKIDPKKTSYSQCLIESVKCHHNKIAKSFSLDVDEVIQKNKIFCFYNFEFFPNDLNDLDCKLILELSCRYDYVTIVKILLQTGKIQLRELLEKTAIFFYSFNKVFRFFLMKFHFTFFSNKISF